MKKTFKFLMTAAAAFAFAACTPNADPEDTGKEDNNGDKTEEVELNQDLAFTLEVTEVEADQAKVKVQHNGESKDTWYGFVTAEVGESDASLIAAEVKKMTDAGKISGLKKQTSTTVTIRGLEQKTAYRYIVFGLSESGMPYGNASSVEFTTPKGETQYKANDAWTVAYAGAGEINGTAYEHTVKVTSTDQNKYFITGYTKEEFEASDIKTIAEGDLAYMKEWLDAYNKQNNKNVKLDQMLFKGNGMDALMLTPGEWYAIAIGVGEDGETSGLYAVSELITIEEEEPTEEYSAWLGNWTITGANGITQEVTISKNISNESYIMTGYEGSEAEGLDILVEWDAEQKVWAIFNQTYGTFTFGEYGDGDVWLVGMDAASNLYLSEEIPICMGGITEDGSYAASGYLEEWEEDGVQNRFEVNTMAFLAYLHDYKQLSYLTSTYEVGYPTFPFVFTQSTETSAAVSSIEHKHKNIQTFSQAPKSFKRLNVRGFVK